MPAWYGVLVYILALDSDLHVAANVIILNVCHQILLIGQCYNCRSRI